MRQSNLREYAALKSLITDVVVDHDALARFRCASRIAAIACPAVNPKVFCKYGTSGCGLRSSGVVASQVAAWSMLLMLRLP